MEQKSLLKLLVETESPSHDKAAVDRIGEIVAEEVRKLGAQVETIQNIETGNHVLARFHPSGGVESEWSRTAQDKPLSISPHPSKPILLLCHMDTVFPVGTIDKFPYREADRRISGPGVLDMKAGIVIALSAIEEVQRSGLSRPITLLCTSDEEIGSHTSRRHIERLAKESALVLVLEGGRINGSLKLWRKGVGQFQVKTRGRAAHAGGDHEKGRNAIEEMAHQIIAIQKLTNYSEETTVNVGVIQGGTVSNVVPEECVVKVDVRVMHPAEWKRLESEMKKLEPILDGTSIEVNGRLNRPPMPFDEKMKATFEKAKSIAGQIGMELKMGGTGGASDANFVAPLGIPVLDGLGAIGEGYHSEREYIFANSLEERAKLVTALLSEW